MRGIGSECVKTDSYQRICHRHIAVFLCAIRTLSHTYTHTHTYTHRHIALGTSPYNKSSENPKSTSIWSCSTGLHQTSRLVTSRDWLIHMWDITYSSETWLIHMRYESCLMWLSHISYEWVMSQTNKSCLTYEWVMARLVTSRGFARLVHQTSRANPIQCCQCILDGCIFHVCEPSTGHHST